VTLASAALAVTAGRDAAGVVAVAAAVLAGQLSVGWSNDALDADRDRRTGRPDKPVAAGAITQGLLWTAALVAGALCVPLSLLSGLVAGMLHVAAVASAWAYNRGLKSTALSVVPYALSFGLLPAFVVLGGPQGRTPPWWLVTAGALLGAGAHFANALPDLDDDASTGVRGLPHRLGRGGSMTAAAALLLAASVVLAVGPAHRVTALGAGVVAVAVVALSIGLLLARRHGSRAAFLAVLVVALVDVALLLGSGTALR